MPSLKKLSLISEPTTHRENSKIRPPALKETDERRLLLPHDECMRSPAFLEAWDARFYEAVAIHIYKAAHRKVDQVRVGDDWYMVRDRACEDRDIPPNTRIAPLYFWEFDLPIDVIVKRVIVGLLVVAALALVIGVLAR